MEDIRSDYPGLLKHGPSLWDITGLMSLLAEIRISYTYFLQFS